jgi:hypothetical protein
LSLSGTALSLLRVTVALPVRVATLPIGSSLAAGWAEDAAGELAGAGGEAGAGVAGRAGAGAGAGSGWVCICASRVVAAVALTLADDGLRLRSYHPPRKRLRGWRAGDPRAQDPQTRQAPKTTSTVPCPRLIRHHAGSSTKKTCLPKIPISNVTFADRLRLGKD